MIESPHLITSAESQPAGITQELTTFACHLRQSIIKDSLCSENCKIDEAALDPPDYFKKIFVLKHILFGYFLSGAAYSGEIGSVFE